MGFASDAAQQCQDFLEAFNDYEVRRRASTAWTFVQLLIDHGFGENTEGSVARYEPYGVDEPLIQTLSDAGWKIIEHQGNPDRFVADAPDGGRLSFIDGYIYL